MGVISSIEWLGLKLNLFFGDYTNFIVRKSAHFIEYMILAILAYNVFDLYLNRNRSMLITIILVFLYACSDEFHQLFIQGREGTFRDVIIDTLGGIVVIIIYLRK